MKIAILMTCHNRCSVTLSCLDRLRGCCIPSGVEYDVWLNDDGSTDGTGAAVQKWYGENNPLSTSTFSLHLICGSGSDYWCGGMRRAWQAAIDSGIDYDGFVWLNDDTMLNACAWEELLISRNDLVVGAISNTEGTKDTYGGFDAKGFRVRCNGTVQEINRMNGNVVFVPQNVFKRLGNFDKRWTHSFGDGDYALLAREAKIKILLTARFVGRCERNQGRIVWMDPKKGFLTRVRNLYSPLGYSEPPLFFLYCLKHDGLAAAIRLWVLQHIHVCFPSLWERKLNSRNV